MSILRTADILRRFFDAFFAPHGLTGQQYNVLRILRGAHPDPLPTMEIANRMMEKTPGITRLLDRLEEKDLIRRDRGAEDRRCVLCSITERGLKLLSKLDNAVAAVNERALTELTKDEAQRLSELLGRISEKAP